MTSAISFVATPNSIVLNRKIPLFCDTDTNGNISLGEALSKITCQKIIHDVDVLLPVAMYGNPPDMDSLNLICKTHGIVNILDSCQSHLATWDNKHLIDFCDVLTHSFYITKNLGCFTECGSVLSNNESFIQEINSLRNHGRGVDNYHFGTVGYNSRPSEISAASLLVKLPFLNEWTERRIELANRYNKNLNELVTSGKLRTLNPDKKSKCVYHIFPIFVQNRDIVREKLLELGVETQKQYPLPLHKQKSFEYLNQGPLPVSEKLCSEVITLPMYDSLLDEECDYVCEKLIEILK
jgi:dTDP-4-amino-4,6-dideoxygalactose transaminase